MTQWGNTNISSSFLGTFYSKIGPLDKYIIFQTAENQWGCLVERIPSKEILQYTITRTGSQYGSYEYQLTTSYPQTFDYIVSNELYCYSNIGYGRMEVLPVHEIMVCWGITGLVCLIFLGLVFKGAIFRCLRR